MYYLKRFNLDADYQSFKGGGEFITPNVSLVNETLEVHYNPISILPDLDITGLNTTFVGGNVYTNEANFFKQLWNHFDTDENYAFSSWILLETNQLKIELYNTETWECVSTKEYDISNERIYKEYISQITHAINSGYVSYDRGFYYDDNIVAFFQSCPYEEYLLEDGTFEYNPWVIGCGEPE